MKAISQTFSAKHSNEMGVRPGESCRVAKAKTEDNFAEMQECFQKLKQLVPTVPRDQKISRVQLLQHVIDYILDLEVALDYPPLVHSPAAQLAPTSMCRAPLSEKTDPNPIVIPERVLCSPQPVPPQMWETTHC